MISIYVDGACSRNPGKGGWAAVAVKDDKIVWEAVSEQYPDTTNNRMEMEAVSFALFFERTNDKVVIYSDSELSVKTLTEWAPRWRDNGWKKKGGIKNLELVKRSFQLFEDRPNVSIKWIKGHCGHKWQERANKLAQKAAGSR